MIRAESIDNPLDNATVESEHIRHINDETSRAESIDNPLADATVEGVEHTRQISGGPQASMMSFEDPETFRQIVSIATAEGQSPLAIMTDPDFEAMFNPDKFY